MKRLLTFIALASMATALQAQSLKVGFGAEVDFGKEQPKIEKWAQKPQSVHFALGIVPIVQSRDYTMYDDIFYNPLKEEFVSSKIFYPALSVGYTYRHKKWVSYQLGLSYTGTKTSINDIYTNSDLKKICTNYISGYAAVRLHWLNIFDDRTSIYIGAGAGAGSVAIKDGDKSRYEIRAVGTFYPLGVEIGRTIYGFAEFGVSGATGCVNFGAGYRF